MVGIVSRRGWGKYEGGCGNKNSGKVNYPAQAKEA
jgi:hypothetical protein